jgi:hypothetical protein
MSLDSLATDAHLATMVSSLDAAVRRVPVVLLRTVPTVTSSLDSVNVSLASLDCGVTSVNPITGTMGLKAANRASALAKAL